MEPAAEEPVIEAGEEAEDMAAVEEEAENAAEAEESDD